MDAGGDSDADGVWMTYGEIAAARGIKRVAAIRLVQRHKWRNRRGVTTVCVIDAVTTRQGNLLQW
jgi:hypothetical protein